MAHAQSGGTAVGGRSGVEKPVVPPKHIRSRFHKMGTVHLVTAEMAGYWVTPDPCGKYLAKDCSTEVDGPVSCQNGCGGHPVQ